MPTKTLDSGLACARTSLVTMGAITPCENSILKGATKLGCVLMRRFLRDNTRKLIPALEDKRLQLKRTDSLLVRTVIPKSGTCQEDVGAAKS